MKFQTAFLFTILVPFMASFAKAQETTQAAPASTASAANASEAAGAGTGSTVSTAEALSPTTEGTTAQWQLNLSSESWVLAKDQQQNSGNAQYTSLSGVGAIYNLSNRTQFELRQYFEYATQIQTLSGTAKQLHQNENEMSRTVLRAITKAFSIFKSKPIAFEGRYYAPNDRIGRENKDNGLLRGEITTGWDLSPKWTLGAYMRGAVQLNSKDNPNAARGSDADYYRLLVSPSMTYNFTDKFSTYYAYYADQFASGAQRGNYTPDVSNDAWHELGLLWTLGPVLVNPAVVSVLNHNNADASLFTENGRYFASENTLYYMNLYATF